MVGHRSRLLPRRSPGKTDRCLGAKNQTCSIGVLKLDTFTPSFQHELVYRGHRGTRRKTKINLTAETAADACSKELNDPLPEAAQIPYTFFPAASAAG